MRHTIVPRGVCPMKVEFDLDGDIVTNVKFIGGCDGNLKVISSLIDGMTVDQIQEKLAGNTCGGRSSSCADQLAVAVKQAAKHK